MGRIDGEDFQARGSRFDLAVRVGSELGWMGPELRPEEGRSGCVEGPIGLNIAPE